MLKTIHVEDGQDLGQVARDLVALARSADLPMPETTTDGPRYAFRVVEEIYDMYIGTPYQEPEQENVTDNDEDTSEPVTRKSRKKKGN